VYGILGETVSTRRSGPVPVRVRGLEVLAIAKGHTRWKVDGRPYDVKQGEAVFVLPGQVFSGIESSESVPLVVHRIRIGWPARGEDGRTVAKLSRALGIRPGEARRIVTFLARAPSQRVRVEPGLGRVVREITGNPGSLDGVRGILVRALVVELLAGICLRLQQGAGDSAQGSATEAQVVGLFRELEARCEEDWSLDRMAHAAGLKRSRFGTLCRRLTGESPIVHLNRLRIRRSRRLLRETEWTVTAIALECGFGSSQYFARTFRRYQGHEPTDYRRLSRELGSRTGVQYIKGDSARNVVFAQHRLGAGDFTVEGELTLDELGGTAASVEIGPDRFGFDGREGRIFVEGGTLGKARLLVHSSDVVREGAPFRFRVLRGGGRLGFEIDGESIVTIDDDAKREIGAVGLRPMRNGIRVSWLRINGTDSVLREPDQGASLR